MVILLVLAAGFIVFDVSSFDVLASSAIVAAIAGFALQDTLGNAFAGIAIQIDKPFRVGHWIAVGSHEGRVTEVTWRATKIRTKTGNLVDRAQRHDCEGVDQQLLGADRADPALRRRRLRVRSDSQRRSCRPARGREAVGPRVGLARAERGGHGFRRLIRELPPALLGRGLRGGGSRA